MIKKAFWGLSTPAINYEMLPVHLPETEKIPTPQRITLFHPKNDTLNVPSALGVGDPVKTGEKLSLYPDQNYYVISTVSGTIAYARRQRNYRRYVQTADSKSNLGAVVRVSGRRTGRSTFEPACRFQRRH